MLCLYTATAVDSFCSGEMAEVWQFVGYILYGFKIIIPLLLIVLGMIDLGKVVISSDDKETKKSISKFTKRIVAAIVIFFIPNLVSFIFSIVNGFGQVEYTYNLCKECMLHPKSCNIKEN